MLTKSIIWIGLNVYYFNRTFDFDFRSWTVLRICILLDHLNCVVLSNVNFTFAFIVLYTFKSFYCSIFLYLFWAKGLFNIFYINFKHVLILLLLKSLYDMSHLLTWIILTWQIKIHILIRFQTSLQFTMQLLLLLFRWFKWARTLSINMIMKTIFTLLEFLINNFLIVI